MRIAQVAPLYESVPPRCYGGTERVVFYLTRELVRLGHTVTLYASGDSRTNARLRPMVPESLRLNPAAGDPLALHRQMIETVAREADQFDVIHFHVEQLHLPVARTLRTAHVATLHGRLDAEATARDFRGHEDLPVVSISDAQRRPLPQLNWQATVHHGLSADEYPFRVDADEYLLFVGRVSPEKGLDRAIEIAKRSGRRLLIAAKVDTPDREYFDTVIQPRLAHPLIEFLGEVDQPTKCELMARAYALVFPIDWPEPFGLVMIEALAGATPVIAFPRGSVPEVLRDGETGFLVQDIDEAVASVPRVAALDRRRCRADFEARFSAARMAQDYLGVYRAVCRQHADGPRSVA